MTFAIFELLVFFAIFATIPIGLAIAAYLVLGIITGGLVGIIAAKAKSHMEIWQFQIIVLLLTCCISGIVYYFLSDMFDEMIRPETNIKEVIVPGVKNSVLILAIPLIYYIASITWSSRGIYTE